MSITWIVPPDYSCGCSRELMCSNGHSLGTIPMVAYYSYRCSCGDFNQVASMGGHTESCKVWGPRIRRSNAAERGWATRRAKAQKTQSAKQEER